MKSTVNLTDNTLIEQMEEKEPPLVCNAPKDVEAFHFNKHAEWVKKKYALRTLPISGNHSWKEGELVEQGVDYEVKKQFLNAEDEWETGEHFPSFFDDLIEEAQRTVAIPIVKQSILNNMFTCNKHGWVSGFNPCPACQPQPTTTNDVTAPATSPIVKDYSYGDVNRYESSPIVKESEDEPKEKILCAAIWYKDEKTCVHLPKNIEVGIVIGGWRHHNCIDSYFTLTGKQTNSNGIQGFLTSEGRFVDRKEAMEIAKESGQVTKKQSFEELYSEDLY